MNWSELMLLLPVGVILGVATVVVFLDLVLSQKDRYILPWVALTGCVLAGMSAVQTLSSKVVGSSWFLFYDAGITGAAKPLILGGAFSLDTFGVLVWILACIAGGLSIISSSHNPEDSALSTGEYYGLTLLAVAGMMLLSVSHDFLTLLISLEIMSISTYILTASNREDLRSNEAGLKYLVLGAFSTAILLMGIAFYYGATGSLSLTPNAAFDALSVNYIEWSSRFLFLIVAMGLIFVGALFKAGASPFHFWIPDVYQGAPTAITGLMAVGVKAAAFAVIARLMFETFGIHGFRDRFMPLIEALAVLTMIIGNILAMRQTNLKRMLAYSGIAHTGYLMLSFLLRPDAGSAVMADHLHSVVFYLFVYGIMTLGAFAVIGLLGDNGQPLEDIDSFQGLAKEHPGVAVCMAIFMLSLAGLPPMGGFFAKFMIFRSAVDQGFVVAAVIGVLTSVASLYYYLRVIVAMYMSPSNATEAGDAEPPARCQYAWGSNLLIYAAGVATLLIGMLPGWFYR
jgi:NADH-quinone oxidoreductase subunit N